MLGVTQILERLIGSAPPGQRKYIYCSLIEIMLFVVAMWAPAVEALTRQVAIGAMVSVAGILIHGNIKEHQAKN